MYTQKLWWDTSHREAITTQKLFTCAHCPYGGVGGIPPRLIPPICPSSNSTTLREPNWDPNPAPQFGNPYEKKPKKWGEKDEEKIIVIGPFDSIFHHSLIAFWRCKLFLIFVICVFKNYHLVALFKNL